MAQWKAKHISIADKAIFGYKNISYRRWRAISCTVERTCEHFWALWVCLLCFINKIFIVKNVIARLIVWWTLLIETFCTVCIDEYTVNIQGLLQCSVDEEIFVWRSEEQRAVTDCQGSTEEVSCVQGQQMMRPRMQVTGEQVSWCSKQYTKFRMHK